MAAALLYFDDERAAALNLATTCLIPALEVEVHRFPDQEMRLRLPVSRTGTVPHTLVIYRSLDRPNDKLIELLLTIEQARQLGAQRVLLVTPYLAYMRQDMAFHPGEVVSQRIVGPFLARMLDGLITVDPHLHRIKQLTEAVPLDYAISLSGAPALADCIAQHHTHPLLIGPDEESAQWVTTAAKRQGWDHGVCTKTRLGDHTVEITLPALSFQDRAVVLLDDVASSGQTLATATKLLLAAGAASVDVAVTHALFADQAMAVIQASGVRHVWSTDCIAHSSNAIAMAPILAPAVSSWLRQTAPLPRQ
ncbi:MAG: ribose-phosphate diphosphokinase [Burkholderiales bacterium]|nr:ribose-phosphate diphosphokinase [Burkholderiales bacterium]